MTLSKIFDIQPPLEQCEEEEVRGWKVHESSLSHTLQVLDVRGPSPVTASPRQRWSSLTSEETRGLTRYVTLLGPSF
ncbi:uncharacterized protein ACO6RY_06376 [Pungitius sinensis]